MAYYVGLKLDKVFEKLAVSHWVNHHTQQPESLSLGQINISIFYPPFSLIVRHWNIIMSKYEIK